MCMSRDDEQPKEAARSDGCNSSRNILNVEARAIVAIQHNHIGLREVVQSSGYCHQTGTEMVERDS